MNNEPDSIKVGVVSMSGEDNTKPCLLANYSRDWGQHIGTGRSHLRPPVFSDAENQNSQSRRRRIWTQRLFIPGRKPKEGVAHLAGVSTQNKHFECSHTDIRRARCTSAAPTYFQQYFHSPTKRTFVDGALRFNNPIVMSEWERRLVWAPETGQPQDTKMPDIMLSVGAGVQARALRASADPRNAINLLPGGVRG